MRKIDLDEHTYERLHLIAAAWGKDEGGAVGELIRRLGNEPEASKPEVKGKTVPVHYEYRGVRVEGRYDRKSKSIMITSGTLSGTRYPKPSPAARAVVASVAPDVSPHRNGWEEWIVTATGETLQSIRYL